MLLGIPNFVVLSNYSSYLKGSVLRPLNTIKSSQLVRDEPRVIKAYPLIDPLYDWRFPPKHTVH